MWPFIGTEHYTDKIDKYFTDYNNSVKTFFNLDDYVYKRKIKYLKNLDFEIIAPSKWMKSVAEKGNITKNKKFIF